MNTLPAPRLPRNPSHLCPACEGTGRVADPWFADMGSITCPKCEGTGRTPSPEPKPTNLTEAAFSLLRALNASPAEWQHDLALVQAADMLEIEARRAVGEPVIRNGKARVFVPATLIPAPECDDDCRCDNCLEAAWDRQQAARERSV